MTDELKSQNDIFSIKIEEPEDEYASGRIVFIFKSPKMYFAFYNDLRWSPMPKDERRRFQIREGIRGFVRMVEKELEHAARDALK